MLFPLLVSLSALSPTYGSPANSPHSLGLDFNMVNSWTFANPPHVISLFTQ